LDRTQNRKAKARKVLATEDKDGPAALSVCYKNKPIEVSIREIGIPYCTVPGYYGVRALFAGEGWIAILGVVLTFANVQGLRSEMTQA